MIFKTRQKLIFDIGMHIGRDTELYLMKGFKVIAIEANPKLADEGKTKFTQYVKSGQLEILNIAISDKKGIVKLFSNEEKDDWSSLDIDWNKSLGGNKKRKLKTYNVQSHTLAEIIEEKGMPYFVKIDIEGSDLDALKSLHNLKDIPKFLSIELVTANNLDTMKGNYMDILSHLSTLGYTKFQVVDQSLNHLTKAPKPSREGKYVDYKFDGHSSGLFGEDLDKNNWESLDKITYKYLQYLDFFDKFKTKEEQEKNYDLYPDLMSKNQFSWFDIHATK